MGHGIAHVFATAGHDAALTDFDDAVLASGPATVHTSAHLSMCSHVRRLSASYHTT